VEVKKPKDEVTEAILRSLNGILAFKQAQFDKKKQDLLKQIEV